MATTPVDDWKKVVELSLKQTQRNLESVRYGLDPTNARPQPLHSSWNVNNSNHDQQHYSAGASCHTTAPQQHNGGAINLATEHTNMKQELAALRAEFEIEKYKRCDAQSHLEQATHLELEQVRETLRLVRLENAELKKDVVDLSKRPGGSALNFANNNDTTSTSASSSTANRQGDGGAGGSSSVAAAAVLEERVGAIEDTVLRHQRMLDDRTQRVETQVADAVTTKVATEVEKIRTVAREAARLATEDLVQVRSAAIQSMVSDQLDLMGRSLAACNDAAAATQAEAARVEHDCARKLEALSLRLEKGVEQRFDGAALASELHEDVKQILDVERRRVDDVCQSIRGEVSTTIRKASLETINLEQKLQHSITQRLDASAAAACSKDEVRRLVQQSAAPLDSDVANANKSLALLRQSLDELRQDVAKRLGSAEHPVQGLKSDLENAVIRVQHVNSMYENLVRDQEELKQSFKTISGDFKSVKGTVSDCVMQVSAAKDDVQDVKVTQQHSVNEVAVKQQSLEKLIGRLDTGLQSADTRLATLTEQVDRQWTSLHEDVRRATLTVEGQTRRVDECHRAVSDCRDEVTEFGSKFATQDDVARVDAAAARKVEAVEKSVAKVREDLASQHAGAIQRMAGDNENAAESLMREIKEVSRSSDEKMTNRVASVEKSLMHEIKALADALEHQQAAHRTLEAESHTQGRSVGSKINEAQSVVLAKCQERIAVLQKQHVEEVDTSIQEMSAAVNEKIVTALATTTTTWRRLLKSSGASPTRSRARRRAKKESRCHACCTARTRVWGSLCAAGARQEEEAATTAFFRIIAAQPPSKIRSRLPRRQRTTMAGRSTFCSARAATREGAIFSRSSTSPSRRR